MIAILIGILFIAFAVYSILPFVWALNWWNDLLNVLKGCIPIITFFIGLISFSIGIISIKDKMEEKKSKGEEEKTE